jgi:hypothetical protein
VLISDHLLPLEFEGRRRMTGAAAEQRGPIAWPQEWEARAQRALEGGEPLTGVANPFRPGEGLPAWVEPERLAIRYDGDEAVARLALAVEAEIHPDLMLVFLPGIDRISHFLWACVEPESAYADPLPMSADERRTAVRAFEAYYEFTDALIGRLAARYGPDDLVLVVSDHGFEAGRAMGRLTGVHETRKAQNGVVFARGRGVGKPRGGSPPSVNDVTPTLLAFFGLPLATDMDGQVASFLQAEAVATVASYDGTPVERLEAAPSGAEQEILEQLEALGYLEHGDSAPLDTGKR